MAAPVINILTIGVGDLIIEREASSGQRLTILKHVRGGANIGVQRLQERIDDTHLTSGTRHTRNPPPSIPPCRAQRQHTRPAGSTAPEDPTPPQPDPHRTHPRKRQRTSACRWASACRWGSAPAADPRPRLCWGQPLRRQSNRPAPYVATPTPASSHKSTPRPTRRQAAQPTEAPLRSASQRTSSSRPRRSIAGLMPAEATSWLSAAAIVCKKPRPGTRCSSPAGAPGVFTGT